jgi:hypothetical protein
MKIVQFFYLFINLLATCVLLLDILRCSNESDLGLMKKAMGMLGLMITVSLGWAAYWFLFYS